jgi:hypothetical protein
MSRDHRQNERHRVRFKLVYDDGVSFNAGHVQDVSESGLFLETALPLPEGTVVRLMPLDDAGEVFEVFARVVRSVQYDTTLMQSSGMGLMFIDLTDEDRKRVVRMIEHFLERAATFHGERDPFLGVLLPTPAPKLDIANKVPETTKG